MDDMVERVARAICCPDGCDGDTGSGKPCAIGREDRTSMQQARAALKETADWIEATYGKLHPGVVCIRDQLS